jgi:hypothetical protein
LPAYLFHPVLLQWCSFISFYTQEWHTRAFMRRD